MIDSNPRVGQLRRWAWKHSPLPVAWEGKTFLIIEESLRWIDRDGTRHSNWTFIIDGQVGLLLEIRPIEYPVSVREQHDYIVLVGGRTLSLKKRILDRVRG